MRVCFIARNDFETKPGGDTVQYQMYSRAVAAAGGTVVPWFDDRALPEADLYHAFNIDRPLELYPRLRAVREAGRPFVVSTIHHPNEWLARFRRRHPPTGLSERVLYGGGLGSSVAVAESVKEVARIAGQGRLHRLADLYPSWMRRVEWILREADRVLLLTHAEGTSLQADFGVRLSAGQWTVLPNWVEGVSGAGGSAPPEWLAALPEPPVLVVGRVEARKNVLGVCRAAERARRPVVFLGRPNPNERRYVAEFAAAVEASRYAHWVTGVPREEMSAYYRAASFLLNASYVEVSPLVDIEALQFGCPVATTEFALHHELLPADAPRCNPYDPEELADVLRWRPDRQPPVQLVDPASCRAQLLEVYASLLERHEDSALREAAWATP